MYAQTFTKPTDDIEVLLGARQVDLSQTVYQFQEDRVNPGRLMQRNPEEFTLNKLYPSLSVKYKLNQDNHIDFAYSQTFIIPDLREFTSGSYVHPYDVATIVGNPNLVNTDIENYDLKYSHYFSDTENVKAGLFYKYLDKPIEDTMQQSSSLPIYSFDNSDFATLYGIELDGRKSFDYIDNSLNDLFLSGNFSYTNSDVSLREEQIDLYSSNHRQLQGLSQIVINLSLAYEIKYRSVVLSYNKMGERIRKVGMIETIDDVQYKYPDDVEIPPQLVDFVWIEKYKKDIELKLKLGNLLDEETIWKQASSVTNRFKTGITYSAGLSYKY
jgi:outer membrane receptor protein involved in Fe transport